MLITRQYCQALAEDLKDSLQPLPPACKKFRDVFIACVKLQRRNSQKADDVAFVGMSAGEALHFRAARASGRLNDAQLQRRLTKPYRKITERV